MKLWITPLVACILLTSACVRTGRMARTDPASVTTRSSFVGINQTKKNSRNDIPGTCRLTSQYTGDKAQSIDLDCFRFTPDAKYTAYVEATGDKRGEKRNRLQDILLTQANFACQLEKGRLYANRATLDSTFDFLSSSFSAASTIVTGELSKSILSGIAGLSTATRSNINSNIYQNQIIPAISLVMDAYRKDLLIGLRAKSRMSLTDFNVDEMIFLVNEYHQGCSFEKGVQLLLNAALNKEGADLIIRDINLRAREQILSRQIREQIALRVNLKTSGLSTDTVDKGIEALQADYQEVALKQSQNSQSASTVTPADVIESLPDAVQVKTPKDPKN